MEVLITTSAALLLFYTGSRQVMTLWGHGGSVGTTTAEAPSVTGTLFLLLMACVLSTLAILSSNRMLSLKVTSPRSAA